MLGARLAKYKKTVSIILLVFCAVFLVVVSVDVGASLSLRHVAIIKDGEQTVRLELNSKVNLQDNTIEKLSKKITVTSTGADGKFGDLVMVTNKCVMFDYTINNKTYYFSAMGTKLDKTSKDIYLTATGDLTIASYSALSSFRNNVNNGTTYSGSTVTLIKDINMGGVNWIPIGLVNKSFQGTFDGGGHTISNFKLGAGIYCGTVGLFGYTQNATIKRLQIQEVTIDFTDSTNEYYSELGIVSVIGYRGISSVSGCYMSYYYDLYIGFVVGRMDGGTISNCNVDATCSATVKAVSIMQGYFDYNNENNDKQLGQMIGGIVGGAYGTISDCSSYVTIDAYNKNQQTFCVSGICGGWSNYGQKLSVSNCLFKGSVTITDASYGTNNPSYLSYGGIVGGGFKFYYFYNVSNKTSTVVINRCVALLDNFKLKNCDKNVAQNDFNNYSIDYMFGCRYSFQGIFAMVPVNRTNGAYGEAYAYCGYTYRRIEKNDWATERLYDYSESTKNYYSVKGVQTESDVENLFFANYASLLDSKRYKVKAHFYNGTRFGAFKAYDDLVTK